MNMHEAIGEAIRRRRVIKKKDLSDFPGISRQRLSEIEQGANTTIETLEKVTKPLGITVAQLIAEADEIQKEATKKAHKCPAESSNGSCDECPAYGKDCC